MVRMVYLPHSAERRSFKMNAKSFLCALLVLVMTLVLGGCTSIGGFTSKPTSLDPNSDILSVKIYALRDKNISETQVRKFVEVWNKELEPSGVKIVIMGPIEIMPRKSFTTMGIMDDLEKLPMGRPGEKPSDRMFLFIGRNTGDVLYSAAGIYLPLPEVFGEVSTTYDRGVVVAEIGGSLVNLFVRGGPKGNVIHEGYHLLGCGHGSWKKCSQQIKCLKSLPQTTLSSQTSFQA